MTKKSSSSDNVRVKHEIKEENKDFDPAVFARDRLKGALQDLMHSDNSTDSEEYRLKLLSVKKNESKEKVPVKKKKHKVSNATIKEPPFQHAFVMKLFDRSVDLAQFEENTPLYPICRAWMANKPRSFANKNDKDPFKKKKDDRRDKDRRYKYDDSKDSITLPPPLPLSAEHITPPITPPIPGKDFKLPAENEKNLPSREVLLAGHLAHWGEIKKQMRAASFKREERFEASKKILKQIFHSTQ